MDYQEAMNQLTRLRSLLTAGGDDSVFSPEDIAVIEAIHVAETGEKVRECGCRDRYADAVVVLYKKLKTRKTMARSNNRSLLSTEGYAISSIYNNHTVAIITYLIAERFGCSH